MSVSVQDSGSTISINDGNSVIYPYKDKITVSSQGNNVRIQWDEVNYVQYPYTDFTAPTGASAAAVAAAIEIFLDTNPAEGIGGSGTLNYILKFTPDGANAGPRATDHGS